MREASLLVILDLFSFPFEAMIQRVEGVPLILLLPPGFDADFLVSVFGAPAFEHLGFFDRVATSDSALWEVLRRRYGWAAGQRLTVAAARPEEAVTQTLRAIFEKELEPPIPAGGRTHVSAGGASSHSATFDVRHELRTSNKALHKVQAAALEPQFAAARAGVGASVPLEVLELGSGTGRWAASFDLSATRFVGLDPSEDMVEAARANFPSGYFELLPDDLVLPYEDESFDLVFGVDFMNLNPLPAKRTLLSEVWRVTRPSGRMIFLENFVASERSAAPNTHPMSVLAFVDLLLEATHRQVVLEHVESLRNPDEELIRAGLLAVSRLGVPRSW